MRDRVVSAASIPERRGTYSGRTPPAGLKFGAMRVLVLVAPALAGTQFWPRRPSPLKLQRFIARHATARPNAPDVIKSTEPGNDKDKVPRGCHARCLERVVPGATTRRRRPASWPGAANLTRRRRPSFVWARAGRAGAAAPCTDGDGRARLHWSCCVGREPRPRVLRRRRERKDAG